MAKKVYGTTIWGLAFLNAIEKETDKGRLIRGKTYANTNKIYDVILKQTTIEAKVFGKSSPFYNTKLSFNGFTRGDRNLILSFIDDNPFILAEILKGNLPRELLEFFENNEIDIFHGFDMNCNCFDYFGMYACKHISALYFILTNEIDKDPFILLKLRGLDFIKHYNIKANLTLSYPMDLKFEDQDKISLNDNDNEDKVPIQILAQENYRDFILSMLNDFPPFAPLDYKCVLEEFYKKITKQLSLVISSIRDEDIIKIQRILQNSKISFYSKNDIDSAIFIIENKLLEDQDLVYLFDQYGCKYTKSTNKLEISTTNLFNLFVSFEDDNGTNSYKYLFYLFRVVYILIEKSGFIPAVEQNHNKMKIIYKPLISIEMIDQQIKILSNIVSNIVNINGKILTKESGTVYILSAILTNIIPEFKFMHTKQKSNPPQISYCFFDGDFLMTNKFENKNIPYAINNYFSVFDIVKSQYKYKLFINIIDKDYSFYIIIQDKNTNIEYNLNNALEKFSKLEIIKFLSYLIQFLPELKQLQFEEFVSLSQEKIEHFLLQTSSIISNLGVEIILPKELKNLLKPKLALSVKSTNKSHKSFFTLDKMLEYNWQISIGDELLSIEEFEKLVQEGRELIQFKDNFIVIDPNEAKAMFSQINSKRKLNKFDILHASLNDEAILDENFEHYLKNIFTPQDIQIPTSLKANLREYQHRGFEWNINNLLNGFGSILADDMGLGKTIQAITTILYLKENKYIKHNILIVVPTSLLSNWEKELEKFTPSLSYFSFYGAKRVIKDTDIVITTYDLVRKDIELFKNNKDFKIDCLIIDEAQKIKNPDTKITKAVKSIKAKYKIALSGTPVENNLSELWSIFDFTIPKYLKTLKDFTASYAKDIEIHKDMVKINKLKKITAPFMLRRLKNDKNIISDLPDKIIIDEYAMMTKEQASLYQSVVNDTMKQLDTTNTKGLIFKLIISLKQICNHPRNFDKKSIIDIKSSGKTQLLIELLNNILIQDEKVLIFTQYTYMADILSEIIEKEFLTTPLILKGNMSKKKRDDVVESFQNDNRYKIFILSLKAGGVGLNLTAANHVIHYDLWFNPAVENQATDRAYRIGQTKKVTVHRLITKNSFEEKIDKMIKSKQELSNLSVNIGENWLSDLDKDGLKELFS